MSACIVAELKVVWNWHYSKGKTSKKSTIKVTENQNKTENL